MQTEDYGEDVMLPAMDSQADQPARPFAATVDENKYDDGVT